jgi:NADPH:quinone reductase-like Zn-dependent oxidoreductase
MRALEAKDLSIDALGLAERPVPKPRRSEILVRIKAASLNYLDLAILAQHKLKPVVDSTFPLEKAAEAFRHMEQGKHFGKIVVSI